MNQIGRYRLEAVEGAGAFATVWRGFDPTLEIDVAVKVLAENWSHHADVRERFLAEARLLRRIDDDRVVRVHDVGEHEGRPYFVMDFISGGTLADRASGLSAAEALRLAAESARAVGVVHRAGVVHRDVKPSNLLIDGDGRVLVADLGSAKRLAEASGITVTTGTPAYMAPEQARGEPVDVRCDVYALGVVAYGLLTGGLPFDPNDVGPLDRPVDFRPPAVARDHELPRQLDHVLASAMATRPDDRPPSAEDLARALESVGAGQRVHGLRRVRREMAGAYVFLAGSVLFVAAAATTYFVLR